MVAFKRDNSRRVYNMIRYPFDEGGGLIDVVDKNGIRDSNRFVDRDSQGLFHGSPTWGHDAVVGTYLKTSNNNYVDTFPVAIGQFGTRSFSVSLWLNYGSSFGNFPLVVSHVQGGSNIGWGIELFTSTPNHGAPYAIAYDGTHQINNYSASIPACEDSKWHFVVAVWDRLTQLLKISVDSGSFFSTSISTVGTLSGDGTSALRIGQNANLAGTDGYDGKLADVRIWPDRILSIGEINTMYWEKLRGPPVRRHAYLAASAGPSVFAVSITESATAATTQSNILRFNPAVSESATAATTQSNLIRFNPAVTETASISTSQSETMRADRSVSETASAADHVSQDIHLIVQDILHATDHAGGGLLFTASAHDSLSIHDSDLPFNYGIVHESMHVHAAFEMGINGNWHPAVHEHASITTSQHIGFNRAVHDTLHILASAEAGVNGVYHKALSDKLFPVTIHHSNDRTNSVVTEALAIVSHQSAYVGTPGIWNLAVTESASAADHATDPLTFTNPGVYFWGYKWAYDSRIFLVSVWCAGLDLGDWLVSPQGYVFVPWQVDADELFTPKWLMDMSSGNIGSDFSISTAALVDRSYGASACNIDLTANDGSLIRVVVDLAIGCCYNSRVQVLRPNAVDLNHSPSGPSLAETRRVHQFGAQLVNAQGLKVGSTLDNLRPVVFRKPNGDKYPEHQLHTRVHWDLLDDDYDYDGMLMMSMFRPYPTTIAALISFMKTFDRG